MNDIEQKKQALLKAYSGPSWTNRVMNMTDAQIIAIYLRLKAQGKI